MATLLNRAACGNGAANTGGKGYCDTDLVGVLKVILTPDNYTIPIADAMNSTKWLADIAAKKISPLPYADDAADKSIEPKKVSNDYTGERTVKPGQIGFTLTYKKSLGLLQRMSKLNGFQGRIFLVDENQNLIFTSDDGINAKGFTLQNFYVNNLKIGTATDFSSWIVDITLKYSSEMSEYGSSIKPNFDARTLEGVEDVILELVGTASTSTLKFTCQYRGKIQNISGLVAADVVFKKAGTPVVISTLTENTDGSYTAAYTTTAGEHTLDLDGVVSIGELNIETISTADVNPGPIVVTVGA